MKCCSFLMSGDSGHHLVAGDSGQGGCFAFVGVFFLLGVFVLVFNLAVSELMYTVIFK